MPKFLHTADWQIGRQFHRFAADDALALAEARLHAVQRIAQLVRQHAVDAVLVAGDIFDAQAISERTLRRVFQALAECPVPWLLLPGNHDAMLAEGVWQRARHLGIVPPQVHIFAEPGCYPFPELGMTLLAAPLTQRQTNWDLTESFDVWDSPADSLRIGLAHGSVSEAFMATIDAPNPIAIDRAHRARLDYLALGDWHGLRRIDARTWYSGTPEPDRFRQNEAGHVLLVDIASPGALPRVEALKVARHEWHEWQQTLHVSSDVSQLARQIAELPADSVLSLKLAGQLDLSAHQVLLETLAQAEARHRSVTVDTEALGFRASDEDLAELQADGYLRAVVQDLQAMQEGDQAAAAREALVILAQILRDQRHRGV